MATDEFGEKSELPTDHRRSEARQKGNVARSQDLNSAGLMLGVALALWLFGLPLMQSMGELIARSIKSARPRAIEPLEVQKHFRVLFESSLLDVAPLLLVLVAVAVFINILQVGVMVTPDVLSPKLNRLNPIEGVKRLWSLRSVVRLFGSLAKLAVVVAVAGLFIAWVLPGFVELSGSQPIAILRGIHGMLVRLAMQLALALLALALIDFAFQKWKHEQDLQMTKQEVREEMKQMEGDPHIRRRRRESHRKIAQAREVQQTKTADVVVTNPTHIAVALKYDPETMYAPTVVAKGEGVIAERIRRVAAESGVPIIERKELARELYRTVRVGQPIPLDLYETFVEIMAYVYRITGRRPANLG
ncbi:MAG: flagellar biosynthesis protein FlhB [Planctomycetaceae bacterium]